MRNNQLVREQEYVLDDDDFLISRTDLKGIITYANPAFVKVSGYTYAELIGANHNLVRHPEMPAVAFGNLWKTVMAGETWAGFVKNLRKNGEFYWVRAVVSPYYEDGQLVGYSSVRIKPDRRAIAEAEAAYQAINAGRGQHLSLRRGLLIQRGFIGKLKRIRRKELSTQLAILTAGSVALLSGSAWLSYLGMRSSDEAMQSMVLAGQVGIVALGAVGLSWLALDANRSIMMPLARSLEYLIQIAAGNLGGQLASAGNCEIGRLTRLLVTLRKSLTSIALDVSGSIASVKCEAAKIAAGNQNLAARTEQQAASLQQTAAAMEELTATVAQNAGNAQHASQLAEHASATVRESGEMMSRVVARMDQITATSRKMSEIVDAIDSIAFQTNILALNASVEAARAGEQGRGFAVVADEVRVLAGRSAEAAKEISNLIASSAQQINEGAQLVKDAERVIEEVVSSVTKVNDIMGEIASASGEQSAGIAQVNQAIAQMDHVTQQNAALVMEGAASALDLEVRVTEIGRSISVFHVKGMEKQPLVVGCTKNSQSRNGSTEIEGRSARSTEPRTEKAKGAARAKVAPLTADATTRPPAPSMPSSSPGDEGQWQKWWDGEDHE